MKKFFRRLIRPAAVALALVVLLLAIWIDYVSYLTAEEDRACEEVISAKSESVNTEIEGELQHVLDSYSAKRDGVGLQVTIVFPDDKTWNSVAGYASHENRCLLSLEHHLYIGSMTKLFTTTLVMDQVEKGSISLDDTLDRWVDLPYAKRFGLAAMRFGFVKTKIFRVFKPKTVLVSHALNIF